MSFAFGGGPGLPPRGRATRILLHPAWMLLAAALPAAITFLHGPMFIDDAFITFRYAENLARGHGFVFNREPVLGTTAALYCGLLAFFRLLGVPMSLAALGIAAASAAAAVLLVWRAGEAIEEPVAGRVAAVLLGLFPWWWLNAKTGMETALAASLAMAVIYLDLRGRGLAAGAVSGLLVLTRPDAALLPALIFLTRLPRDRKRALWFAGAAGVVLVPWLVFAWFYFGSPVPQSLPAKKLIHYFPADLAARKYLSWFFAFREPWLMAFMSLLYLGGAARVILGKNKRAAAFALWPAVHIAGLSLTRVGPFFWYKIPALPAFFLTAALAATRPFREGSREEGESFLGEKLFRAVWEGHSAGAVRRVIRAVVVMAVVLFGVLNLGSAFPFLIDKGRVAEFVEKERILAEAARLVRDRASRLGRSGPEVKVFAGEVGVIGWELLDYTVIDSAGINSPEVYEIRKRDQERLRARGGALTLKDAWEGTPEWTLEVIRRFRPDFIVSNLDYLHLRRLSRDASFKERYREIQRRQDRKGNVFVVYERKLQ